MAGNRTSVGYKLSKYHEGDIMTASPEKLIIMLYDQAILGCKQKNEVKAGKAIAELIDSLNPEIAFSENLFNIYRWSLSEIKNKRFGESLEILSELRDTWKTAIQNLKAA